MPEAEKPIREPRALSTEYHRARKQLVLWSAILLIWALIGVDLEKAKDAQGGIGAIIGSLKSPQAVPWALVILIFYFLFKCTVEWYQCNETRRKLSVAKVDFRSAWFVALLAYSLYFGQLVSQIQFADWIGNVHSAVGLSAGLLTVAAVGYAIAMRRMISSVKRWLIVVAGVAQFGLLGFLILRDRAFLKGLTIGLIVGLAWVGIQLLLTRIISRKRLAHGQSSI